MPNNQVNQNVNYVRRATLDEAVLPHFVESRCELFATRIHLSVATVTVAPVWKLLPDL